MMNRLFDDSWLKPFVLEFAPDRHLHYWQYTPPAWAHTAIFIHGNKGTHLVMTAIAWEYAQAHPQARIVLIDLPGFGQSSPVEGIGPHNLLVAYQAVLAGLLQKLSDRQYRIIGHSFGALLALSYVRNHTDDRIVYLYLFALSARMERLAKTLLMTYAALGRHLPRRLQTAYLYNRLLNTVESWYFTKTSDPALRRRIFTDRRRELHYRSPHTVLAVFALLYSSNIRRDLHTLSAPAVFIHGQYDNAASKDLAQELAKAIQAPMVVIPHTGHFLINEAVAECGRVFVTYQ